MFTFNTIDEAVNDISQGKIVIVVDDENRENEGDFVMAAELVTADSINFMAQHGRGLICVSVTEERARKLHLSPMIPHNTSHHTTAFTVSIDAADHITTGISAYDRALTIQLMTKDDATPADFVRPGHIFPLVGIGNGVLARAGHTEASIELASLAHLAPSGVICEIMKDDGTMARLPDLIILAQKFDLKLIHIQDLIAYKLRTANKLIRKETTNLPTEHGTFQLHIFENSSSTVMALTKGVFSPLKPVLTRVHSECATGELFASLRCDCGEQLKAAMKMIEAEGAGIIIYLKQEGRGIGLINKIKAYQLQDQGFDTVDANKQLGFAPDLRDYAQAADILHYFSVECINLITNNPLKIESLSNLGIKVANRIPTHTQRNQFNEHYLTTKKNKMGHLFSE